MNFKKFRFMAIFVILVLALSGCGRVKVSTGGTDNEFTVVTSFYPIYIATINVTKDIPGVRVVNMTKPQTGCLHDYQLKPKDLITLEGADAFVINGAGMETFLDKALKQLPDLKIVEASKGIELIKDQNGEENPHVWVSISNEMLQVSNIAEQLAAIDPANSANYKKNAETYIKKLQSLRDEMYSAIDSMKNRDIITFHEAFPYFAKEFNLKIAAVIEREPGTEPSPSELEKTIDLVNESGIKVLFAEPQYSSRAAKTIAAETDAKVYTLDPGVTGDAKADSYDDYINMMKKNMNTLVEALG